ncbi:ATPase [Vibrio parahaemolyticus]|nr:ATPase [Vibrio parahaemolyticus]MBE3881267.1 ATPase [Vibrio parahaemolyticus]MBE4175450.1 ATPase [Vibrio parahaemolyticus]MBE4233934.1 ATPase [Vibrio parahaemolyticus]MBE4260535.1 ATPase [Vibrio parahaemolyticus]
MPVNHLLLRVIFALTLLVFGRVIASELIQPQYLDSERTDRFFAREVAKPSKENIEMRNSFDWGYELELRSASADTKSVSNCKDLANASSAGFTAAKAYEYGAFKAFLTQCQTWSEMAKLAASKRSYLSKFKLDNSFPSLAPSALAFVISNESAEKAKTLSTWDEADRIQRTQVSSPVRAEYFDATDGFHVITIVAKGDYNADGIEDIVIEKENSVLSGSYSSSHGYVLTRMSEQALFTVLAEW